MTRKQWLAQADEWDKKAQDAYEHGDEIWGEACEKKACACRTAADYAPDKDLFGEERSTAL